MKGKQNVNNASKTRNDSFEYSIYFVAAESWCMLNSETKIGPSLESRSKQAPKMVPVAASVDDGFRTGRITDAVTKIRNKANQVERKEGAVGTTCLRQGLSTVFNGCFWAW